MGVVVDEIGTAHVSLIRMLVMPMVVQVAARRALVAAMGRRATATDAVAACYAAAATRTGLGATMYRWQLINVCCLCRELLYVLLQGRRP